jgi:hypothetical protein
MSDEELMAQVAKLEEQIGAPGFWEQPRAAAGAICDQHCQALSEAVRRGLTTFTGR